MSSSEAVDVERSILGGVLIDCGDLPPGLDMITPGDFIVGAHRSIFRAMLELHERNEPIDIVTVNTALEGVKPEPSGGWFPYIGELTDATPTSANVEHYAKLLRSASRRRDFITVMTKALERAKDPAVDGDELMADAVTELGRLAESRALIRPIPLSEAVRQEFNEIEQRQLGQVSGLPTGFESLDAVTGGMPPGSLNVVAARPGMGKTAFANNVVHNVAVTGDGRALVFSLEMSAAEQAQRSLAAEGHIDLRRIRSGQLKDSDWSKLARVAQRLHIDRVQLVDRAGLSILELRSIARQYAARHNLDLIVVDYLQLMEGTGDSREQQVASICRGLKALATELRIPIIALSQLNRGVEQRQDKRPQLSDLRESGAIEQDAHQVLMIYRDDYYHPKSDDEGLAEFGICKNRNGPVGMRKLRWFGEYTLFTGLDEDPRPQEREQSEYEYEN